MGLNKAATLVANASSVSDPMILPGLRERQRAHALE